jgi:hypothetical protein
MAPNAKNDREIKVLESIAESLRVIAAKPVVIEHVLSEQDLAMVEENFPVGERPWYFLLQVATPSQDDPLSVLTEEDLQRLYQYAYNLIEDRVQAVNHRLRNPLRPIDDVDLPDEEVGWDGGPDSLEEPAHFTNWKRFAEDPTPDCGDPDCQHAPDGGNHPVNPS